MINIADKYRSGFIYLALAAVTLGVYWQVRSFEFINYDDDVYVSDNSHIRTGFTRQNIKWVFTHEHGCNWHPLTGLSHMLDCQLFGLNPGRHHLVNLLFHIANTLLLFTVLRQMTGAMGKSAFAAALFALHPLHVESVAWISERKDVLSTLFWILTMMAYFRYVKTRKFGNYILTVALFALGLMSKPMLVTLPFVLVLLDYWPLNRMETNEGGRIKWQSCGRLVREKIPFFVLSGVSSVITLFVQKSTGAVAGIELLQWSPRVSNAVVSYVGYIAKMIWPVHLAAFYPHQENRLPFWQVFAATAVLALITILVIWMGKRYKYLPVGWFWYMGTLVPVIGIVQVGNQAMADRYTYVPLAGLFIIIAFGISEAIEKRKYGGIILTAASAVIIPALAACTWFQAHYWHDSIRLFEHAAEVTSDNCIAYGNIGSALLEEGKFDEALKRFNEAVKAKPYYVKGWCNLGIAYNKLGRRQEEMEAYQQAIKLRPDYAEAHYNLGIAYGNLGRRGDEIEAYKQAIKYRPNYSDAYYNLGVAYGKLGRYQEEAQCYRQVIEIKPDQAEAYNNLGAVCNQLGQYEEAVQVLKEAISIKPGYAEAYSNLGSAYLHLGRYDEAIEVSTRAVKIIPDNALVYANLGTAYKQLGHYPEAISSYRQTIRIKPDYAEAYNSLGILYDQTGQAQEAIEAYEQAIKIKPDYASAYNNLGTAYGRLGKYPEAIEAFKGAIKINPSISQTQYNLGNAYNKVGRLQEAVECYRQVIKLKPDNASAHYQLGLTLLAAGDSSSAMTEYEILKKLDMDKANELFKSIHK